MQIERETSDLVAHNDWSRLVNKLHLSADYRMWVSTNPSLQTVQCILSDTKDHQVSVGMGKGINCMPILGAEFESVEHFFYSSQTHLSTQRMFVSQIIEQDFDFTNDPALNLISKNTKVTVDSFTDIENSRKIYYPSFLNDVNFIEHSISPTNHAYQYASDNGFASGSTINEALLHSVNELIERDSVSRFMIKYGLGLGEATVDAYKILPDSLPEELRKIYYGLKNTVNSKVILVKVINPYKIPTYFTAVLSDGNKTLPIYGSGSSIDEDYAIMRSLTEAYQLVSVENENESQQLEKRLHKMWSDIPSVQRMLSLSFTEKLPSIRYCRCNLHMKKVSEMIDFETTELRRTGRKLYYRVVKESQGFVLIQSLIPHFERFNLILEGQIVVPRIKA